MNPPRIETGQNGQQALSRSGARVGWGVGVGGAPLLESSLLAILACLNAEIFLGGDFWGGEVPLIGRGIFLLQKGTCRKIMGGTPSP